MHALIQHEFGDPAEVIHPEEVEVPRPGPGQVRSRTVLSPIHNHDLWTIRGTYGFKPEMPAGAGTEALGVIEELGQAVTEFSVGQRVAAMTFGVWADSFVADAAALVPVPDGVPDEAAAQLIAMPFSAISLLDTLDLHEGQWLALNAANGTMGRLIAQLAGARGIHVLGLVRRAGAVDELAAQGIHGVVSTDSDDWRTRASELTGGDPVVVGIDSAGGQAGADLLSLLADDGRLVVFGAMEGPIVPVPSAALIFRGVTITGFWGSKVSAATPPEKRAAEFAELAERLGSGVITLPADGTFPFAQFAQAVRAHEASGRTGKVLLRP